MTVKTKPGRKPRFLFTVRNIDLGVKAMQNARLRWATSLGPIPDKELVSAVLLAIYNDVKKPAEAEVGA